MLVGGKLEPGESALDAALRETRRGGGLSGSRATLLGEFLSEAANEPGHTLHSTVFWVESDAEPVASAEIAEVRWTPLDDHPDDLAPMLEHHVLPVIMRNFYRPMNPLVVPAVTLTCIAAPYSLELVPTGPSAACRKERHRARPSPLRALTRVLLAVVLSTAGLALSTETPRPATGIGGTCVTFADAARTPLRRARLRPGRPRPGPRAALPQRRHAAPPRRGRDVVGRPVRPGLRRRRGDSAARGRRPPTQHRPAVPDDVFDLSSRPGSDRTIYLDFDGATHSGTHWANGAEIVSPAYSIDADPASFSETERAQVYLAWQVVAEDFAAFDVDVTTRTPPASALTRSSAGDRTYGMPVVVTPTNTVGDGCGCGGSAYVGVFGALGATDAQPAWVFTRRAGTGGHNLGEVISHEVGHTFGLEPRRHEHLLLLLRRPRLGADHGVVLRPARLPVVARGVRRRQQHRGRPGDHRRDGAPARRRPRGRAARRHPDRRRQHD